MRRVRALAAMGILVLFAARTNAGGVGPCARPFLFKDARVNVVVLPYQSAVRQEVGDALALLIQMNTLAAMLKYNSVGSVKLFDETRGRRPNECHPDRMWAELTKQLADGHGLILVWGRIFEEESQIYEQTFIRYVRRGAQEDMSLRLGAHTFRGLLSGDAVALPPQTFSQSDLETVARVTEQYANIRSEPKETSPSRPMVEGIGKCFGCGETDLQTAYSVIEQQGDWIRVRGGHGEVGWVKLQTGFGEMPLSERMPELHLIDGTVGYLQTRIAGALKIPVPESTVRHADRALTRYLERLGGSSPATGATIALEMRSMLSSSSDDALSLMRQAVQLAPADARATNLLAIATLRGWAERKKVSQPAVAKMFVAASVLDPDDREALTNLKNLYQLVVSGSGPVVEGIDVVPAEEAKSRLEMVSSILAKRPAPAKKK